MKYAALVAFVVFNFITNCSSNDNVHKMNSAEVECNDVSLSRKKRALTFPSGSSLQLVYDQTMPIAAAQLLFTVGVTCALAFSLPDVPLHNLTDTLREDLQKRLHPELFTTTTAAPGNDSMENSASMESHNRIDGNVNDFKYVDGKPNYYNLLNKHNYYYFGKYGSKNGFKDKSDNLANKKADDLRKVVKTFINKYGEKVITMKVKKDKKKKKLGNVFIRKHNRVYPVFGKRSIEDHLSIENIVYADHHRNSRFDAYAKIEGFLNGRSKDGTACVLRALCETAQRNQNEEKAPFLMEILRAIFTLPHQVLPYKKSSHQMYDDAHSNLTADCAQLYSQCKDSIWSPDFRF